MSRLSALYHRLNNRIDVASQIIETILVDASLHERLLAPRLPLEVIYHDDWDYDIKLAEKKVVDTLLNNLVSTAWSVVAALGLKGGIKLGPITIPIPSPLLAIAIVTAIIIAYFGFLMTCLSWFSVRKFLEQHGFYVEGGGQQDVWKGKETVESTYETQAGYWDASFGYHSELELEIFDDYTAMGVRALLITDIVGKISWENGDIFPGLVGVTIKLIDWKTTQNDPSDNFLGIGATWSVPGGSGNGGSGGGLNPPKGGVITPT